MENLEKKKEREYKMFKCKLNYKGLKTIIFNSNIIVVLLLFILNKGYLNFLGLIISFISMEIMVIIINFYNFVKYEKSKMQKKSHK